MTTKSLTFGRYLVGGVARVPVVARQTVEVNWLDRELPNPDDQRKYAEERCRIAVTEHIAEVMAERGISRSEMAKRLAVTKGRVSAMFADTNLTLRTVGNLLWACQMEVQDLVVGPLGTSFVSPDVAEDYVRSQSSTARVENVANETGTFSASVTAANDSAALAA